MSELSIGQTLSSNNVNYSTANSNAIDTKAQEKAENKITKSQEEAAKKIAKAQEEAEKRIAKAREEEAKKIVKVQEEVGKDGIITDDDAKKIAKALEEAEKRIAKAQEEEAKKIAKAQEELAKDIAKAEEKGFYINHGTTDTVSISKEGMALSREEARGNNINNFDKQKLRRFGEIYGKELKRNNHENRIRGKWNKKHRGEEISNSQGMPIEKNGPGKNISPSSLEKPVEQKDQGENISNLTNNLSKEISGSENPYKDFLGFLNGNGENGLFQQGGKSINVFA